MARYVDGFVLVIPRKNLKTYQSMAKKAGKIWLEHGAITYCECTGDDMKVPMGLPFPKLTKLKAGEMVIFSFIVYKSRAQRDRVNAKVMSDPRINETCVGEMPFDLKRMSFGGFETIVDLGS